nr:MAG TPA: hypothetical protein [Caudoviricetes sp.]
MNFERLKLCENLAQFRWVIFGNMRLWTSRCIIVVVEQ